MMAATAPAASCIGTEHGCVVFDCLVHLWEWLDPPIPQSQFQMENKKQSPATQQPLTQHHLMAHHVHADQIYSQQSPQIATHMTSPQPGQLQSNGVMNHLLQNQYHSNMNPKSPLLENRHELYGTRLNQEYGRHYGTNDNFNNYPQSPPRVEQRTELHTDHNVNHELHNIPKGYNAEVHQDYLKRNPPKDTNQIYQNHQPSYASNLNQYASRPYLPYSNRIGNQSNTEMLRRQYNELQQMKLQQQLHYQSQAQIHQQQKFAERQLLLQQIHGVQPPPNLQNSIYSDGSYRDIYNSKSDFKDYNSPDIQKDVDRYIKNNEFKEIEKQNRQYQESQYQSNQQTDYNEIERYRRQSEGDKGVSTDYNNQNVKNNVGVVSPMKSSESSSPSVKSPSSDSRKSSSGQALRSPIAQRIPTAPVTVSGILYKQGSDGLKVWRKRWFVLSEYCLFYYKSQDEEKLLGSVLLPSYKVSACTSEDKVLRKFAFKLEHANMRTYILAAPDQDSMLKWVKALTMAALMQTNDQVQKHSDRTTAKSEDNDETPGPTYANAPPKPRRSNEGYNSPSPDLYDPNYDLLKKPASHYSQGRYQEQANYSNKSLQENNYSRNPQSPPVQHQPPTQNRRLYDTQQLSLPLNNTHTDRMESSNLPSTSSSAYKSNPQSPYFDNRHRIQQQLQQKQQQLQQQQQMLNMVQDSRQEIYERQVNQNPFLQDPVSQIDTNLVESDVQNKNYKRPLEQDRRTLQTEEYHESQINSSQIDQNLYNRDMYGELNSRPNKSSNVSNDRLVVERRTPDAYGRSASAAAYNRDRVEDYEDVYSGYNAENEYGQTYAKSPNLVSPSTNYAPEKTFSGPAVLRRKKMQASGIQPPVPRPHSADFLEYEAKNQMFNKTLPSRSTYDQTRQPQRPKSSLDINSYYDPSSDRYYSEESYAEKMRQSAQYLAQQGFGPKNIQIPLAKYASGLAEKQLHSPYSSAANNNYELGFSAPKLTNDGNTSDMKYGTREVMNSNWLLKEKELENEKEYLNRSGSVMSEGSTAGFVKEGSKFDPAAGEFARSASARLPSSVMEKDGEKKVQQREESMKRLLEWKQRMLQSPLTRKSTPATISLARSLNHSRQSLRSDQFKSKSYTNAPYNSYSSDDEEETTGSELLKPRDMQAGRSYRENITSPIMMQPHASHASSSTESPITTKTASQEKINQNMETENFYENIGFTETSHKNDGILVMSNENSSIQHEQIIESLENHEIEKNYSSQDGYETHESEAESETQMEYTDDDLDEVLSDSNGHKNEENVKNNNLGFEDTPKYEEIREIEESESSINVNSNESRVSDTPPVCNLSEEHYLPMSPRKLSTVEPAHKSIIQNLSVFDKSMPEFYEDNPYVEMNIGGDEDDMQTYEVVCVNNNKVEPVYMELCHISSTSNALDISEDILLDCKRDSVDIASNFADTKEQTLKRVSKTEKLSKCESNSSISQTSKPDVSDIEDDISKDSSTLETPFSRFSISDNFRPASYYLRGSSNVLDYPDSSDSEVFSPPSIPNSSPLYDKGMSDEALSQYILDKLDKSDMSQDNSILKMLTSENQKMNTAKRKTTSLMIYGSKTSIHDTLSRGEKIRNSRASLTNERKKMDTAILSASVLERYNSSSIETDSLKSYNADRGSSRLSLESDVSSKFEMTPSNISSEVTSLNDNDNILELRHVNIKTETEMLNKRRPLSDDSLFQLVNSGNPCSNNFDLDNFLDNLQPSTSKDETYNIQESDTFNNNIKSTLLPIIHSRCSSTPVSSSKPTMDSIFKLSPKNSNITEEINHATQNSCSSSGATNSPMSYYCKNYNEEEAITKNLNCDLRDKIKEFEIDKIALNSENSTTSVTNFHSRESSTEHSAPYYYSDLSSQEHINVLPTSHFLKNTNLYRKLNNQRHRGHMHKRNEISHIHNPIHNNQVCMSNKSFDLAANTRSVSVEFLSAADKDPDIDTKNIYECSIIKSSKIPESMNLISGLGCKSNSSNKEISSADLNVNENCNLNSSCIKLSTTSMSSENSSNTVYYDAEAETNAYENIMYQGEKHWDEDTVWRDNLRRVSHRHARSLDNLDTAPIATESATSIIEACGTNSIKRIKKECNKKITRNVTYVNCDIQNEIMQRLVKVNCAEISDTDDNDVYVSLADNVEVSIEQSDEGVYEQLAVESSDNSLVSYKADKVVDNKRKRFEIDREKLRQWDLMSSGLMKGGKGRMRGMSVCMGVGDALCSTDSGADSTSNEASISIPGQNLEPLVNNSSNHQTLSNKSFLGSNTSIGRSNRDSNIPVRAVSPRVRWVEEKPSNEQFNSHQKSSSQQALHTLSTEDAWTSARSPSRASQQPIRAVSPRIRHNTENGDLQKQTPPGQNQQLAEIPSAGELLGRTHEELVLLLIQLRRRHAATHRAIEQCCAQINSIEDCLSSLKAMEREESVQRLEQLKMQLMELEHQYEKSKPLVQLVDNMVKLGSLYNKPGTTLERLERNQRLRHKVLAEHALEQQRWLKSAAAGKPLETEAARARVAELWALEQELADEAAILQGLKTDKDALESLISGVRNKIDSLPRSELARDNLSSTNVSALMGSAGVGVTGPGGAGGLEAELARVHAMLALNSKKLEQTVLDNARLERELQQLRRALQQRRAAPPHRATALLENEVSRVQQLVTALQRQRQELSRAVRHLTQQSHALQTTHDSLPGRRRIPSSSWQETNLDSGHTVDHGHSEYDYDTLLPPGHYEINMAPLYVDTRASCNDVSSPLNSEDMQHSGFANLSNVEKQEIKTVRIVKRESERRQRDRERSLQPTDWPSNSLTANLDQFLEEELIQSNYPRTTIKTEKQEDYYYSKNNDSNYLKLNDKMSSMDISPKYVSSPSLSNYDYSRDISSLSSSYTKSYDKSGYDRTISLSTQYLNSPTDSNRTLTNDPLSKTNSISSLTRSTMELSPIFKSEAAKQIITEMSGEPKNGSLHRRQVPKEKRRHYTAPHHLSAKTLNEMPTDVFNQDKLGRSLDDADMERALRGGAPDVVRSALPPQRFVDSTIDDLLAAPQKIVIPERYIPEKPPELSPEEQQKRQEKVESIKKMLSSSSTDNNKSPDGEEKKQRAHLLQMNQILAKQVTEMSKIIAVKALEELPHLSNANDLDDRSPDMELPIYQQRDNFYS